MGLVMYGFEKLCDLLSGFTILSQNRAAEGIWLSLFLV